MEFETSDGLKLYFDKSGKGVPCVYLHGGPGYWSKSFQYFSKELLEEEVEMVYMDQRGCGRSEHSCSRNYSLNRLVDDVEELRISLNISEWFVMGHSFGGILAINYANRFPERTKGIILSNVTLNFFDSFSHQIQKGFEVLEMEKKPIQNNNVESFMDTFYSILSKLIEREEYFTFQYDDLTNKILIDAIDEGLNSDPTFQQYVFSSGEYFQDFTTLTEHLCMPALIIAGKTDHAIGPEHHHSFKFKNSKVKILESSHHPYIESPLEFKDAVLNFVRS